MPNYNKSYYKNFIQDDDTQGLFGELLQHLHQYATFSGDRVAKASYDELILKAGKWKGIQQEVHLGIGNAAEVSREKARINYSLLHLINQLPDRFFTFLNSEDKENLRQTPDIRQQINLVHQKSNFEYDAFFSFSSSDLLEAKRICEELRGYGLNVFLSDEALKASTGTSFFEKIDHALKNSQHFILLSSPISMQSEWVKTEYETFFNEFYIKNKKQRRFFVLKSKNFSDSTVPGLLRRLQFANNPKEILATFVKDQAFQNRNRERERKTQLEQLERQALAEKRKRQQAALEQKALQEQRLRSEQKAIEAARLKKEQLAAKQKMKQERREKQVAFFQNHGKKIAFGIAALLLLVLSFKVIPPMFDRAESLDTDKNLSEFSMEEDPAIEPITVEDPAIAAEDRYQQILAEADDLLKKGNFTEAKNKYRSALSAIADFDLDETEAENGIKNADVALKKETVRKEEKILLPPARCQDCPEMVFVKGGTFEMGCTVEQSNCGSDEKPTHQVTLSDFSIGKYEVTQKQWKDIMRSNPSHFKNCDQCPVEKVSWNDIQKFIEKLNQKTNKNYRLPTEAEWEYAARGGQSSKKYKFSGSNNIDAVAWYGENSSSKTHEVGKKRPNELGIYDMSGNVWEWCQDWYDSSYYENSPRNNPKGADSGSNGVLRGGGWNGDVGYCRVANRYYGTPEISGYMYGYRLVHSSGK